MERYGAGNGAARILLHDGYPETTKSLFYFYAKPFPEMKRIADFYDSGATGQLGHDPRFLHGIQLCCGKNSVQQQWDSRTGIISLPPFFSRMAQLIRKGNMDKPHGFSFRMVKDQGDAGAEGIGAQYISRAVGDGPATDFHHLESAHAVGCAKESLNESQHY